jgi:cytosine/adenosine deaminase-related metal-dependent hydrolase
MILNNVTTITGNGPTNIYLKNSKLKPSGGDTPGARQLDFGGALAFPGLVNSHDHLDFNLFPQLGDKIYNNYTEWGNYIHTNYKQEIDAVLKVPLALRANWGIFKNLLCGVTTVVNHGEHLAVKNAPITVEQGHSIHSVQFEKWWKLKLNNPLKRKIPAMIHIGEGDDNLANDEIDQLNHWNLLHKKLIGVHGIAMTEEQAKKFEALVWCPESNYFLFNKTAKIDHLKKHTTILFGTDSTLTGNWNIWDHIRLARKTKMLTDAELYNSVHPGGVLNNLTNVNDDGTIVIAKRQPATNAFGSFYATDPADILLVMYHDQIRLFDTSLLDQLKGINLKNFSQVFINGSSKYVEGDLPGLMQQIKSYYPDAVFPVSANS